MGNPSALDQRTELSEQRRRVDFDTYDVTVDELLRRVAAGRIDIAPVYQRQFRWDPRRQSRLIESVLLGIPVPPLFMATNRLADVQNTWEVVGGMPVDPDNLNQWLASVPANTKHHPRLVTADCGLGYGSGIWGRLGVKIKKVSRSSAANFQSAARGRVDRTIWNELGNDNPLIAEVWTGKNPHYVVITGEEAWQDYYWTSGKFDVVGMNGKTTRQRIRYQVFSDDGDYLINDPAQNGKENEKGIGLFRNPNKRHYSLISLFTVHRI